CHPDHFANPDHFAKFSTPLGKVVRRRKVITTSDLRSFCRPLCQICTMARWSPVTRFGNVAVVRTASRFAEFHKPVSPTRQQGKQADRFHGRRRPTSPLPPASRKPTLHAHDRRGEGGRGE